MHEPRVYQLEFAYYLKDATIAARAFEEAGIPARFVRTRDKYEAPKTPEKLWQKFTRLAGAAMENKSMESSTLHFPEDGVPYVQVMEILERAKAQHKLKLGLIYMQTDQFRRINHNLRM